MSHSHVRKTFLQLPTICKAQGICCPFALAYARPRSSETAALFGVSTRTIQRLRLKILQGKVRCEGLASCSAAHLRRHARGG